MRSVVSFAIVLLFVPSVAGDLSPHEIVFDHAIGATHCREFFDDSNAGGCAAAAAGILSLLCDSAGCDVTPAASAVGQRATAMLQPNMVAVELRFFYDSLAVPGGNPQDRSVAKICSDKEHGTQAACDTGQGATTYRFGYTQTYSGDDNGQCFWVGIAVESQSGFGDPFGIFRFTTHESRGAAAPSQPGDDRPASPGWTVCKGDAAGSPVVAGADFRYS